MKQTILLTLLIAAFNYSYCQSIINGLSKILTVDQAKSFMKQHPAYEAKLYKIENGQIAEEILSPLRTKKLGYAFNIDNFIYKIVNIDSTLSFRVSYIFLDGTKLQMEEIDSLRRLIISKFNAGEKFENLAAEYNMDGNKTGDTDWFHENTMVASFEIEVKNHQKGEIFTVDTPENKWYHVVLKTYKDSYFKNFTILKIKNSIQ